MLGGSEKLRGLIFKALCVACLLWGFNASAVAAGEYTNFFGIKLVDIPAGSFAMGACKMTEGMHQENRKRAFLGLPKVGPGCDDPDEQANDNETPIRTVTLQAFKLATTPVTVGQYKKYLDAIGEVETTDDWGLNNEEFRMLNAYGDDAPVVQIAWHEAKDFIRWLNANKPEDDPYIYRMPSEAEWEYACRAGSRQLYCGSDDIDEVGWANRDGVENPSVVETKAPNAWGLYGMSGSIWQWVEDVYHDSYVGAPTDGSAWTSLSVDGDDLLQQDIKALKQSAEKGEMERIDAALTIERLRYDAGIKERLGSRLKSESFAARVLRGGSWRFGENFARATYRLAGEPGNWYYRNGFRVAASLP